MPISYPPGFRGRASGTRAPHGRARPLPARGRRRPEPGLLHGRVRREDPVARPARLAARRARRRLARPTRSRSTSTCGSPSRCASATPRCGSTWRASLAASGTLAQPTAGGQVSLREGGELTLGARASARERRPRRAERLPGGQPRSWTSRASTRVSGVARRHRARAGALDDLQLTLDSRPPGPVADRPRDAAAHRPHRLRRGVAGRRGGGRAAGDGPRRRAAEGRGRHAPDRRLARPLAAHRRHRPDPALQRRHPHHPEPDGHLLGRARRDREALDRRVQPRRRALPAARDHRGGQQPLARGDRPLLVRPVEPRPARPRRSAREIERLACAALRGRRCRSPRTSCARPSSSSRGRRYSGLQREQAADRVRDAAGARGLPLGERRGADSLPADDGVELVLRVEPGPARRDRVERRRLPGRRRGRRPSAAWPAYATPEIAAAAVVARRGALRLQAGGLLRGDGDARGRVRRGPRRGAPARDARARRGRASTSRSRATRRSTTRRSSRCCRSPAAARSSRRSTRAAPRIANDVRLAYAGIGLRATRASGRRGPAFDRRLGPAHGHVHRARARRCPPWRGIELPEEVVARGRAAPALAARARRALRRRRLRRRPRRDRRVVPARRAGSTRGRRLRSTPGADGVSVRYRRAGGAPAARGRGAGRAGRGRRGAAVIRRSVTLRPGRPRPARASSRRAASGSPSSASSARWRCAPSRARASRRCGTSWWTSSRGRTSRSSTASATAPQGSGGRRRRGLDARGRPAPGRGRRRAREPLRLGLAGARLRASSPPTGRPTGVNLDAASFFGLRLRTQLFVYDDDDEDTEIAGVASRVKGMTFQQTRALLRDLAQPPVARPAPPAVGLHVQGHRLRRGRDEQPLPRREPRLREPVARSATSATASPTPRAASSGPRPPSSRAAALGSDVDYGASTARSFALPAALGRLVWAQGYRLGVVPGEDPLLLHREPLPRRRPHDRARLRAERPRPA